MEKNMLEKIIALVIALVVMAIVLPMGIGYISRFEYQTFTMNGTSYAIADSVDSSVINLVQVLLPILAIVGLLVYFIPKLKGGK